MNRKRSQDDHVLNRLPLLKYSWVEVYSLIFHYLPSPTFAYLRSVELVSGTTSSSYICAHAAGSWTSYGTETKV